MDKKLFEKIDTIIKERDSYKATLERIKELEELRSYERSESVYDIVCAELDKWSKDNA